MSGLAEIGEALHAGGVAGRHHDRERVGCVGDGGAFEPALLHHGLDLLEAGEIRIGFNGEGHVADRDRAAGVHLVDQQARRDGLPEQLAFVLGMLALERLDQRRHGEEVIAANVEHELGVVEAAVEIGHVVHLRHGELQPTLFSVVVGAVLPGRKHDLLVLRRGVLASLLHRAFFGREGGGADGGYGCRGKERAAQWSRHRAILT